MGHLAHHAVSKGLLAVHRDHELVRPAFFTPVSKPIDDLLQETRSKYIRMAILVDEYGGMAGIVSMEDLVEEIVGELADEGETDAHEVQTIDGRTSIVEGQVRVEDINFEPEGNGTRLRWTRQMKMRRRYWFSQPLFIRPQRKDISHEHNPDAPRKSTPYSIAQRLTRQ